jgi:hypothetical protein
VQVLIPPQFGKAEENVAFDPLEPFATRFGQEERRAVHAAVVVED